MTQILAIAGGGAVGALLRFWVSGGVYSLLGRGFPYGTLAVNILGSLLMGFLYVLLIERLNVSVEWRAALMVGLLGAFTTFSTFSIETLTLIEAGELFKAVINMVLSVVACVAAAWLGLVVGRAL
ncbi:camphor resistance protein CrcB [Solemya pervernicosa gill symbiont]|uniref:Fluoride-specific ion channel FluC n=2 Tax=Gammaproteobacteria incertae sedis TaxID=118884 RepID=A0A1T2L209_9GAMM|nr:fluoride efflux transporter CrcB [Candidatus Reidiella endopervernicosa]OOZ39112.1 camphor resistance protein CrcB [Solemya pervernicosa gill symbiont]QKQ26739.1 fluoride efflux transporter CrcB [Candidatus Reidiella endopervernicosa]